MTLKIFLQSKNIGLNVQFMFKQIYGIFIASHAAYYVAFDVNSNCGIRNLYISDNKLRICNRITFLDVIPDICNFIAFFLELYCHV